MSPSYIEGFCKTASALGVDPEKLLKSAGLDGILSRYGELLSGSSPKLIPYRLGHGLVSGAEQFLGFLGKKPSAVDTLGERIKLALGTLTGDGETSDELRKVYATRLATGAAALGAIKWLTRDDKEKDGE